MNGINRIFLAIIILISSMSFAGESNSTVIQFRIRRGSGTEASLGGEHKKLYFFAFPSKESFENDKGIAIEASPLPDDPETYITKDLKPGKYTFSAFEDTNKNGQHDKNFVGMPKEPFAISKIKNTLWSRPEWEDTSCQISDGQPVILDMLLKFQ